MYEKEMRYLGIQLSNDGKLNKHVMNRKRKAFSALSLLRSVGLISNNMSLATKAYLLKVYIRPIVNYGLDIFNLNSCEFDQIKSAETMVLKQIIGVNKQIKNTTILSALNKDQSSHKLIKNRITLYKRLLDNEFTCQLLE